VRSLAPASASVNLVDSLQATLDEVDEGDEFAVVALRAPGDSDLAVMLRRGQHLAASAARASRALVECHMIARSRRAGQRILVRLTDAEIARAGAELEAGRLSTLRDGQLLAGQRIVVDFCDPNATKALHVGHLRNVALGQACACLLEAAGAHVSRQSQIADAGQQMGEAMAGYLEHGHGRTPEELNSKPDHFVGRCYAAYVSERGGAADDLPDEDRPVAREMAGDDEVADSLLRGWQAGEPESRELWRTIRDWVVTGHAQTLSRLGIEFDRPILESDYFPLVAPLVRTGIEHGILAQAANGAVVYETGDPQYPVFPLSRPDGFPNQNLRALAFYHAFMTELPDATLVQVCGNEWRAHHVYVDQILRRLCPGAAVQPARTVLFELVHEQTRGIVSSSGGDALLIDDLLDQLAAHEVLRALAVERRPGCGVDDLAAIAALGFCLEKRMMKPMNLSVSEVLDESESAGLTLARAWARAWSPAFDGPPEPQPGDPAYRFAVVEAQFHRARVLRTVEALDVVALTRSLSALCRWYLSTPHSASTARVVRSLLRVAFRDLGLRPRRELTVEA
jgi:arginyl-tRNA synthetase